jgi:hypothetical protein
VSRATRFSSACASAAIVIAVAAPSAHGATSLVAAYDTYVQGQGFDIKLVDVGTGKDIPLPQGVNTTQDEYHPALTADGQFLVFTRAQVQPLFDGTVLPPANPQLLRVDRKTGDVRGPLTGADESGTSAAALTHDRLSYSHHLTPPIADDNASPFFNTAVLTPPSFGVEDATGLPANSLIAQERAEPDALIEITSTGFLPNATAPVSAWALHRFDKNTGALIRNRVNFRSPSHTSPVSATFTSGEAGHPTLRYPDGFAIWDATNNTFGDLTSKLAPDGNTQPVPAAINTSADERAPSWSPDGTKVSFIRTDTHSTSRILLVFDTTPGVQALLNQGVDIGLAPTPQLRKFESIFGATALATETRPDATTASCTSSCIAALRNFNLAPNVTGRVLNTSIGIIVAKVTGTTTLFGKKVQKIKPIGRVPLGKVKNGKNSFKWDGKVNHKKLAKGNYLLTFRLLTKSGRVSSTSNSVAFKVRR